MNLFCRILYPIFQQINSLTEVQTAARLLLPMLFGFVLDLMFGDPHWMYHPVRLIGKLITVTERIIRGCFPETKMGERIGGALLVLVVLSFSSVIPLMMLFFFYHLNFYFGILAESLMCYQILAIKSLKAESDRVYLALKHEGVEAGRKAVSMIVGRDTKKLTCEGVTKAAIETVAENTSDGVIAPMFYMTIGGAALGFAYKAINTMDSMIGYKNDKYRYFGTAAAKLDDAANFLPARLSAYFMIVAAWFCKMDWHFGFQIYKRDRFRHKSPNAAQTEAVMAGVLHIQLAGDAWYFGKLYRKPTIGDAVRPVEIEDIRRAHRLLYGTAILGIVCFFVVKWLASGFLVNR